MPSSIVTVGVRAHAINEYEHDMACRRGEGAERRAGVITVLGPIGIPVYHR